MKIYLFVILWFSIGCGVINKNPDQEDQQKILADKSKNMATTIRKDSETSDNVVVSKFDILKARLIDSILNPKTYLYDQVCCDFPSVCYSVQYLLLHGKVKTDTVEVGHSYIDNLGGGKIIQYYSYTKNSTGIIIELKYNHITYGGLGDFTVSTYWKIFDVNTKKLIFSCNPNNYSTSIQARGSDTIIVNSYNGYAIEIKNDEIIITDQVQQDPSATYSNDYPDFKNGIYKWKDTSFIRIK